MHRSTASDIDIEPLTKQFGALHNSLEDLHYEASDDEKEKRAPWAHVSLHS